MLHEIVLDDILQDERYEKIHVFHNGSASLPQVEELEAYMWKPGLNFSCGSNGETFPTSKWFLLTWDKFLDNYILKKYYTLIESDQDIHFYQIDENTLLIYFDKNASAIDYRAALRAAEFISSKSKRDIRYLGKTYYYLEFRLAFSNIINEPFDTTVKRTINDIKKSILIS